LKIESIEKRLIKSKAIPNHCTFFYKKMLQKIFFKKDSLRMVIAPLFSQNLFL